MNIFKNRYKIIFIAYLNIMIVLVNAQNLSDIKNLIDDANTNNDNHTKLISALLKELNSPNLGNNVENSNSIEVKKEKLKIFKSKNEIDLNYIIKSASSGDAKAQYILGIIYSNGYGVEQNYIVAKKWYLKAAKQGNKDALLAVKLLNESN